MRKMRYHYLLIAIILSGCLCACSANFAGGRIDTRDIYTARSFLVGAESEVGDYGLYSYLLFPAPPTPATKARYEAAVRAFLGFPPAPAADRLLPHESVNIFYLMLMENPSPEVERCLRSNCYPLEDKTVTSILGRYNYVRAQIMLRRISPQIGGGPYIATVKRPLTMLASGKLETGDQKVLLQDMSTTPSHLVRSWTKLFIEKATGQSSAHKQDLNALMLHLRAALDGYAAGLPKVFDACVKCLDLGTSVVN